MTEGINSLGLQEVSQYLVDLGKHSKLGQVIEVHGKKLMLTQGSDGAVKAVSLDEHLPEPLRICQRCTFDNVASFAEYVTEFKGENTLLTSTCLRSNIKKGDSLPVILASLDYHGKDEPSQCTHVAVLQFRATPEAQEWFAQNNVKMSQSAMADFIEDHMHRIVEPDGADLMELIQTLSVTEKARFKSKKRNPDGSFSVEYSLEMDANAGKSDASYDRVEIPGEFTVRVGLLEGDSNLVDLKARLRFKMERGGEGLSMWYSLVDASDMIRARLLSLCGEVEELTDKTILFGGI